MPDKNLSRRDFLEAFSKKDGFALPLGAGEVANGNAGDTLFKKYSRKNSGRTNGEGTAEYDDLQNETAGARVGNVTTGLAPYTGTWSEWEALYLLRRTGFGAKKTAVDNLLLLGNMSAAVDAVLTINTTPPPEPTVWYNKYAPDYNGLPDDASWVNSPIATWSDPAQTSNYYRNYGLGAWLWWQALNSDNTIREKMVWFWYHFLPVDATVIFESPYVDISTNSARILYDYMKMFRDNATGNYKTIITNLCKAPAMMHYLNNQSNSVYAPDENFARELMELFTLGKDPASQYTQQDVIEAAKVLTGWRVQNLNTNTVTTDFIPWLHHTANKQFSAFFNNHVINYRAGADGAFELDEFIDMIFSKAEVVSQYICRRIYRYFVYYDIDANIEANVIVPLAQTFVASNWEILPVLKQLFKSEHFFDMANRGVYIKNPFDLVIGTFRTFNVNTIVTPASNTAVQYQVWDYFNNTVCGEMEQRMGSVPNVSGWNAYYQSPQFHEYWINTNTIQKRFKFLSDHMYGYYAELDGASITLKIYTIPFVSQFGNTICANPNLLVAACVKYLLPVDLSVAQQNIIKFQTLLFNQSNDAYWTTAWNNYAGAPTNTSFAYIVEQRLQGLMTTIVQLAEYQLI